MSYGSITIANNSIYNSSAYYGGIIKIYYFLKEFYMVILISIVL